MYLLDQNQFDKDTQLLIAVFFRKVLLNNIIIFKKKLIDVRQHLWLLFPVAEILKVYKHKIKNTS